MKKLFSSILVLIIALSPMQTLMAQSNQNFAMQDDMNQMMMTHSMMQSDCQHCLDNGHIFLNCSIPAPNNTALNQLLITSLVNQMTSRLSITRTSRHIISHFPNLVTKPPIA